MGVLRVVFAIEQATFRAFVLFANLQDDLQVEEDTEEVIFNPPNLLVDFSGRGEWN